MLDQLFLARLQFGSTTVFHYFFVPMSIGLAFLIAIYQTLYVVKKNEEYKTITKFWSKFFLINFAVGVVTGIIQEFQFGMNWSEYSRFVGDVFGAPLAIEALLAFFMESTFIGLWIFGWDKLPKKIHLMCIWLVSIGTTLSALWILSANSFMQNPVGYELVNGRAQMTDFGALLTNSKLWVTFPHVIAGALACGSFLIIGISAIYLRKGQHVSLFKKSMNVALIAGFIAGAGLGLSGHAQTVWVMENQPMKFAASEGLYEDSEDPAGWAILAGIDTDNNTTDWKIEIPGALSFLGYGEFKGSFEGMNSIQEYYTELYGAGDYIPPVKTVFYSFRLMAVAGGLMMLVTVVGLFLSWRQKLVDSKFVLKLLPFAIAIPYIGNTFGWIMAEIGRQPWVVNGLMLTSTAVSPNVSAGSMLFSLIAFCLTYAALGAVLVFLFVRQVKQGPIEKPLEDVSATDPFHVGGAQNVTK